MIDWMWVTLFRFSEAFPAWCFLETVIPLGSGAVRLVSSYALVYNRLLYNYSYKYIFVPSAQALGLCFIPARSSCVKLLVINGLFISLTAFLSSAGLGNSI